MDLGYIETLDNDDLEHLIRQMHALAQSASAIKLAAIAEFDQRDAWKHDYMSSMSAWLAASTCVKEQTAKNEVRIANALAELPAVAAAYADASLSFDQINALTRYATPETDAQLAKETVGLSPFALEREARRHHRVTAEEAIERHNMRSLRAVKDRERGTTSLYMHGPSDEVDPLLNGLRARVQNMPVNPETGRYDPYDQRMFDALLELAAGSGKRARNTVVVHVRESALRGGDGYAELEDGTQLAVQTVERLMCDARIEYAIHDDLTGRTVGFAKPTKHVPGKVERDIRHRDLTCQMPGCDRTDLFHNHHAIERKQGGHTIATNLPSVCAPHHRFLHEHKWKSRWVDNGWQWQRPDGRIYNPAPQTISPDVKRWLERVRSPRE